MEVISRIHQIMIVDGMKIPNNIAPFFRRNELNIKKFHPESDYKLWSGEDIRSFLSDHFSFEVIDTFDCLKPYAYKADLARLCILYVYGGLYIDLGTRLLRPFDVPLGKEFCAFRDLYEPEFWLTIMNCIIYSKPKRPELLQAIRAIVENKKNFYYGKHLLFPTGPVQLGRAVASVAINAGPGGDETQWIGESRPITPSEKNRNITYMTPHGALYALRAKTADADLLHMGLEGGNNYLDLWDRRQIYGEKTSVWDASYERIRVANATRTDKGIRPHKVGGKLITWGPFIALEAGDYIFRLHLSGKTFFDSITMEVTHHPHCSIAASAKLSLSNMENSFLELPFSLEKREEAIELKTYRGLLFHGLIVAFEIEKI